VFVRRSENPVHACALRIFTPRRELPFAGHPTVGTAAIVALDAAAGDAARNEMMLVLEERVGPVRCGVSLKGPALAHVRFDLPRTPETVGPAPSRDALAAALGLLPSEIGFENHQPSVASAGVPFVLVPVRNLTVIGRARANMAAWAAAFGDNAAYLYCRETTAAGRHFHARMFATGIAGIAEDPATGVAAAALGEAIRLFDEPPGGSHRTIIEQGFEMGRPSLIALELDMDGGRIVGARLGGDAVVIARGSLDL
jgi:trans-2,3-dihydro-3-hydroxyanthranilate isomerase